MHGVKEKIVKSNRSIMTVYTHVNHQTIAFMSTTSPNNRIYKQLMNMKNNVRSFTGIVYANSYPNRMKKYAQTVSNINTTITHICMVHFVHIA